MLFLCLQPENSFFQLMEIQLGHEKAENALGPDFYNTQIPQLSQLNFQLELVDKLVGKLVDYRSKIVEVEQAEDGFLEMATCTLLQEQQLDMDDLLSMMMTTMNWVLIALSFGKVDDEKLEKLEEAGKKVGTKRDHIEYQMDCICIADPYEHNWVDRLKKISIR